jgi:hypothetical protein
MNCTRIAFVLVAALATAVGHAQTIVAHAQTYAAREVSSGGFANAISFGVAGGSFGNHAALWTGAGLVDVHPAGSNFSAINGRSGELSVGYAGTASLSQAPVIWQGTAPSVLSVPFAYVTGRAVATDGDQIVGYAAEGDPERGLGASHAMLWDVDTGSAVELGKDVSVFGVGGGAQVGTTTGSRGPNAALWRGTANSFVDLHVAGYDSSVASGTNGLIQVGYVGIDIRVRNEARPRDIRFYTAGVWSGTASSFTSLPSSYRHSFALGIKGDTIVGYGDTTDAIGTPKESHAVAWVGPTYEYVDLHALLPADMRTSRATGVDELGNVVGYGCVDSVPHRGSHGGAAY